MLKHFPKILTTFFLSVFIFQLSCLLFLALAPTASQAADPATFKPQVEIPGMKKEFGAPDKTGGYAIPGSTASIAKYIRVIYKYAIGIVGILAAVVLMIGGVIWITAGGNAERIGEAKAWIASSLTGLLLALLSYTILATVNPALVNFQVSSVPRVKYIPVENSYTASSYSSVTQDNTIGCGEYGGEKNGKIICGTKCGSGTSCQKTQDSAGGAKKCPINVLGSETGGDWWLCSTLGGGDRQCCRNNDDCAKYQPGFVCSPQAQISLSLCDGRIPNPTGICRAGTGSTSGGIPENQNCRGQEDQCATGLHCSTADYRCRPEDWELPGLNDGDPCGPSSQAQTKCKTADYFLGIPQCPSEYKHYTSGRSCTSGLMCCYKD